MTTTKERDLMAEYAVVDPTSGEQLAVYPTITNDELRETVSAATAAHQGWDWTISDRAAAVAMVGHLHSERREELAATIVREMGKPVDQALGEVDFCASIYSYYADNAAELMRDEPITLLDGEGSALIRRSSLGVLLGIMPWNYPYYQVARFAAPNLIIGNTILLKHAPQCPESASAIQRIFDDAGFPPGVYSNIYASVEQVESLIADPRVRGVSVTGSERAGAAVAALAGKHLKKVVLELGGSDPFILLGTDDLDAVVEQAVSARLDNAGQACNAAKRFIVIDDLYDEFLEKFTTAMLSTEFGDPAVAGTAMGPLSSAAAADRLAEQVDRAVRQGAHLAVAGQRSGCFYPAGVITNLGKDNDVYYEELFGPVAVVHRAATEADAVGLANDTPFGLGSYVFSHDRDQALRAADQLETGMVFINLTGADSVELPFGGVKRSGWGRELGRLGAEEFVNKKMIRIGA
jgi:succinate-semialdehyde dehydrogenase/glutarate-semialdehyde dehydrogenase